MEATVLLSVEETNQSYIHSNITQRLHLVHMAEVTYVESGDATTDRDALQNPSDLALIMSIRCATRMAPISSS